MRLITQQNDATDFKAAEVVTNLEFTADLAAVMADILPDGELVARDLRYRAKLARQQLERERSLMRQQR